MLKTLITAVSTLVLQFSAINVNAGETPQDFSMDKLVGTWYQNLGGAAVKNKNIFRLEKISDAEYKGSLKIVESKKTINYAMVIKKNTDNTNWTLYATRDGETYEWNGVIKSGTIYFTKGFNEKGEVYYSRQGFAINENGELLRILEKSYDNISFQGIEEKYSKE